MPAREGHLEVTRTARYSILGEQRDPAQLWIVCHGYRQLAGRFIRDFEALDDGARLIVAPEALSRFYFDDAPGAHGPDSRVGATWMTREDREAEIGDYVRYLDRLAGHLAAPLARPAEIIAFGFSQGAATAARWAAMGTVPVRHLVLWAGHLPPDLDLDAHAPRLRAMRGATIVVGSEDSWATAETANAQSTALREAGVPCDVMVFDGGHRLDAPTLVRLAATLAPPRAG